MTLSVISLKLEVYIELIPLTLFKFIQPVWFYFICLFLPLLISLYMYVHACVSSHNICLFTTQSQFGSRGTGLAVNCTLHGKLCCWPFSWKKASKRLCFFPFSAIKSNFCSACLKVCIVCMPYTCMHLL